ncbi:MAG: T9SS type A sorting domain-containing protein [Bacteroidales bacterium]|nr:T9SS type A sorting domain-containing protein [Bacteroidales bacterium]
MAPNTFTFKAPGHRQCPAFSATAYNISNRATGSASVNWSPGSWTDGVAYTSPDLKSIIQQIVDRGGWTQNSFIVLTIGASTTSKRTARTFDYNGNNSQSPSLSVTYTTGSGGSSQSCQVLVRARMSNGTSDNLELRIDDNTVHTWNINTSSFSNYTFSLNDCNGNLKTYFQDNGTDMQIDYIEIDGVRHQAEDQAVNTSVYENGSCGGDYAQSMHCPGYIDFGSLSALKSAVVPNVYVNLLPKEDALIFPNPSAGMVNIVVPENTELSVYSSTGQMVYGKALNPGSNSLDLNHIEQGVYYVRLSSANHIIAKTLIRR